MYLQSIRTRVLAEISPTGDPNNTAVARTYFALVPLHSRNLAGEIEGPISALVSPPTRRPQLIHPYMAAMKLRFPASVDLTNRFSRSGPMLSGEDATLTDVIASLSYVPGKDEATFKSVVITDDVLSRGFTAAALIHRLFEAGVPPDCTITVAVPLWLPRKPKAD